MCIVPGERRGWSAGTSLCATLQHKLWLLQLLGVHSSVHMGLKVLSTCMGCEMHHHVLTASLW